MNSHILKLCLLTNIKTPFSLCQSFILEAIAGGVTSVQLREKESSFSDIFHFALQLKTILNPLNIPLIINDHIHIAKAVDAAGVHLGQNDISPTNARKILGPHKLIGWSIETFAELEKANQLNCIDYVAASAVFRSKNKSNCKTIWGLTGLRQITKLSKHPVVGIGGINITNIKKIMDSGACGAAVISAIHDHPNSKKAAAQLIKEINTKNDDKRPDDV